MHLLYFTFTVFILFVIVSSLLPSLSLFFSLLGSSLDSCVVSMSISIQSVHIQYYTVLWSSTSSCFPNWYIYTISKLRNDYMLEGGVWISVNGKHAAHIYINTTLRIGYMKCKNHQIEQVRIAEGKFSKFKSLVSSSLQFLVSVFLPFPLLFFFCLFF